MKFKLNTANIQMINKISKACKKKLMIFFPQNCCYVYVVTLHGYHVCIILCYLKVCFNEVVKKLRHKENY